MIFTHFLIYDTSCLIQTSTKRKKTDVSNNQTTAYWNRVFWYLFFSFLSYISGSTIPKAIFMHDFNLKRVMNKKRKKKGQICTRSYVLKQGFSIRCAGSTLISAVNEGFVSNNISSSCEYGSYLPTLSSRKKKYLCNSVMSSSLLQTLHNNNNEDFSYITKTWLSADERVSQ